MPSPNHSFHVVSKQDLGAGIIPRDRARRGEEITQNHVVILLLYKATQFMSYLWPAVLGDPVRLAGEDASTVITELAETPGRGQTQWHANDVIEYILQFRVKVILVRAIKREKRDWVMPRQLPKNVVTADFPPGIGGNQSAGLYP